MPKIPSETYDYLLDHPDTTGRQLYEMDLATSDRTARRWKGYYLAGKAERDTDYWKTVEVSIQTQEQLPELDLDRIFQLTRELVALENTIDPVYTLDTLNFNTDRPVAVMFPSCVHFGGRYTAYEDFEKIFNRVLDMPRVYWASLGDDVEGFLAQFPNAESGYEQIFDPRTQIKILEKLLGKLDERNKLLFGLGSQHGGKWFSKNWGTNPIKALYLALNKPFYDGKAYIKFEVGSQVYNVAVAHFFKGDSQWNPLQPHSKAFHFDFPNADLLVMGDKHQYAVTEAPAFEWEYEAGNRASNRVLMLQSGTAKTGPDKYTISGWSRGQLGWPTVVFYPDTHKMKWSWDLDDVERWLE